MKLSKNTHSRTMLVVELAGACAIAFWLWDARHRMHSSSVVLLVMLLVLITAGSIVWFRRSSGKGEWEDTPDS